MRLRILLIGECEWLARRPGVSRVSKVQFAAGHVNPFGWDAVLIHGCLEEDVQRVRALNEEVALLGVGDRIALEQRLALYAAGLDEYLELPCDARELDARIAAWTRRANATKTAELVAGAVRIDFAAARVYRDGVVVPLSAKEWQLLRYLASRPNAVFSRAELLRNVWGYRSGATRTVDVHVAWVRQKIEENPRSPEHILTIRGKGYLFRAAPHSDCKEVFTESVSHGRNTSPGEALVPDRRL